MTTELMWKSLELFSKLFLKVWSHPIDWNVTERRSAYISSPYRVKLWYFINFCPVFLLSFCPSFVYLMRLILTKESALNIQVITALVITVCSTFCCFANIIMRLYGEETCNTINEFISYEAYLRARTSSRLGKHKQVKSRDITGTMLYSAVIVMFALTIFNTLYRLLGNSVTPMSALLTCLMDYVGKPMPRLLLKLTMAAVSFVVTFEMGVVVCGTLLVITIGLKGFNNCITLLGQLDKLDIKTRCILHNRVLIITHLFHTVQAAMTALLMSMGVILSICSNYATIKMASVIPMPFYLFFPTLSVFIPLMISVTLPHAIICHEASKKLLWTWKRTAGERGNDRKYLLRKLRSMRPIRFYCGIFGFRFFLLSQSTKSMYYRVITDYTITAILSVPL